MAITEMDSISTYFNPHSRKGSDYEYLGAAEITIQFQSTLPQGE